MKKILFALSFIFVFTACTKENDDTPYTGNLVDGIYAHYNSLYGVAISTTFKYGLSAETYCEPGYISIMDLSTAGYVFTQIQDITQIERAYNGVMYSGWQYSNGLSVLCIPKSETSFTGIVLENKSGLKLPEQMDFAFLK